MHDWTLLTIQLDWKTGVANLTFRRPDGALATIAAEGVCQLDVPRRQEWGPSVSVNSVSSAVRVVVNGQTRRRLTIEMQSGDVIAIEAASFVLPPVNLHQVGELAAAGE